MGEEKRGGRGVGGGHGQFFRGGCGMGVGGGGAKRLTEDVQCGGVTGLHSSLTQLIDDDVELNVVGCLVDI